MIKMKNCKGSPLHCSCNTKFEVKLGDFDSAGAVPGLGIKEPTDQLIKFASILPLGTPGYRAPEVSIANYFVILNCIANICVYKTSYNSMT